MSTGLSADQLAEFAKVQARFGLRPDQFSHEGTLDTANFGGRLVLSSDPATSHVAPIQVPYATMAELKSLAGVPDEEYASGRSTDQHIDYPPPLPPDRVQFLLDSKNVCDLRHNLTDDEHATLKSAAQAYLVGNSAKVQPHEALLNEHMMPGTLAVFAGADLVVQPGHTLEIDPGQGGAPVAMNYQSVTVDTGGEILVNDVPLLFVTQVFVAQ